MRNAPSPINHFIVRTYTPFRGKHGKQQLEDHLKRLPLEMEIEMQKRSEFMANKLRDAELEKRAIEKLEERRDWDNKFTTDEINFIDSFIGKETFEKVAQMPLFGIDPTPQQELLARMMTLESFQSKLAYWKEAGIMDNESQTSDLFKEIMAFSADRIMESRPSVAPVWGFPPNEEIMKRHTQLIEILNENSHLRGVARNDSTTLRSPFGPVSSSACFEEMGELRTAHLKDLHTGAGFLPNTKILLTVRHDTFVSPSKTVTALVEDEDGQLVTMQIFNMKGVQPHSIGLDTMPIGARFYLKNPFLKIGQDGWLLLRVDQPFDLVRLDFPPLKGNILVVGDGDFAFSVSLAKQNAKRGTAFILASSLDTRATVVKRYNNGKLNLDFLADDPNVAVYHGLDASDLSPLVNTSVERPMLWELHWECI